MTRPLPEDEVPVYWLLRRVRDERDGTERLTLAPAAGSVAFDCVSGAPNAHTLKLAKQRAGDAGKAAHNSQARAGGSSGASAASSSSSSSTAAGAAKLQSAS